MKKLCELCECPANVVCGSDQAMLCWGCDWKVHGANFLVGKHLRVLLCHGCQAPTPWSGSGPRLVPTVSFCQNCVVETEEGCGSSNGGTSDDDDEMENQVVPWLSLSLSSHSHSQSRVN